MEKYRKTWRRTRTPKSGCLKVPIDVTRELRSREFQFSVLQHVFLLTGKTVIYRSTWRTQELCQLTG